MTPLASEPLEARSGPATRYPADVEGHAADHQHQHRVLCAITALSLATCSWRHLAEQFDDQADHLPDQGDDQCEPPRLIAIMTLLLLHVFVLSARAGLTTRPRSRRRSAISFSKSSAEEKER